MIVQVYRNLHRRCWSVRDRASRRVVGHENLIILADCTFRVSEAGRRRVLATGRKNVHAYVQGNRDHRRKIEAAREANASQGGLFKVPVSYDPRKGPSFVRTDTGEPVTKATLVILGSQGAWACDVS